MEKNPFNFR